MLILGAQETQIVVRFVARVGFVKTAQQLGDLGCPRPHELLQQARESLFSLADNSVPEGGIHTDTVSKPSVFRIQG